MRKTLRLIPMLLIVSAILLSGCKGKQAKDAEEYPRVESKEELVKELTTYPIPTAFEIVQMLNRAGAAFIIGICNPVDNAGKYITESAKAINLGIYGADLAYSTTYQMKQETMSYLTVSKRLIDELNVGTTFSAQLVERVEKNIDNKDSLINLITNSYYDTYKSLTENQKESLSLLVVAGSWIEGVYITSQIAFTSRDNGEFLKILAAQKVPLSKLMELMAARSEVPEIKALIDKLTPINDLYCQTQGDSITDKQFKTLIDTITKIRESLI